MYNTRLQARLGLNKGQTPSPNDPSPQHFHLAWLQKEAMEKETSFPLFVSHWIQKFQRTFFCHPPKAAGFSEKINILAALAYKKRIVFIFVANCSTLL